VEETMKRLCPFEHKTTSLAWNPIDGFLQVIGVGCFMIFFKNSLLQLWSMGERIIR